MAGKLTKSFQYSPWGERLSQVKVKADSSEESSYYGYNPHTDVEQITSETGDTRATYGYTAYGKNDDKLFTGVDKPDPADPTAKEEYNPYRFNAKRWDNSTGMYDMGFRDYNPGLNRFLNLDSHNGALDDLSLGLDPWTANRYAFTGGNPINGIELDGHEPRPWHNPKYDGSQCAGNYGAECDPAGTKPRNTNVNLPSSRCADGSCSTSGSPDRSFQYYPPGYVPKSPTSLGAKPVGAVARGIGSVVSFGLTLLTILTMTCGDSPGAAGCEERPKTETKQDDQQEVVVDTNIIAAAMENGRQAEIASWLANRRPVVVPQVAREYTEKDPVKTSPLLNKFLETFKGRMGATLANLEDMKGLAAKRC
ncbi:RHS repeat domain-containing protein [Actinomadura sp. ATCC 39365]